MREQHPASFRFFIATLYFGVLMQFVLQGDAFADPLYIVASLGDELSPDEVRGNLQRGLPRDPQISCNEDGIRVEPMSSFHYNWLTTKLGQAPQVFGGRTLIEPDADSPDRWRLYLGDQNEDLERLEVLVRKMDRSPVSIFKKHLISMKNAPIELGESVRPSSISTPVRPESTASNCRNTTLQ